MIKLCKNCNFAYDNKGDLSHHDRLRCKHPNITYISPVDGSQLVMESVKSSRSDKNGDLCKHIRLPYDGDYICGINGDWWEEKE